MKVKVMAKKSTKKSAAPTVNEAIAVLVDAATTPPSSPHGPPVAAVTELSRESTDDAAYGGAYVNPVPAKKSKFESSFSKTLVIGAIKANPKKPGSAAHQRYNLYKTGMTVEAALKAGLRSEDLRWDLRKGHITLS